MNYGHSIFFIIFLLSACTGTGGAPLGGGNPGVPLDSEVIQISQDNASSTLTEGTAFDEAFATPDRQGVKIDLDPQDNFFPILVPNVGGPYIFEECFDRAENEPACKYFTIDCGELSEYTVEQHPDHDELCRIHEIMMIWGDCSSLKFCHPILRLVDPEPSHFPDSTDPIQVDSQVLVPFNNDIQSLDGPGVIGLAEEENAGEKTDEVD